MIELDKNPIELDRFPKELLPSLKEGFEHLQGMMEQMDGRTLGLLGYSAANKATDYDNPMLVTEDWGHSEVERHGKKYRIQLAVYAHIISSDWALSYIVAEPREILDPEHTWRIKKDPPLLVAAREFSDCDAIPHFTLRLLRSLLTGERDNAPEIYARYIYFPGGIPDEVQSE
jgi:hypothetical protein